MSSMVRSDIRALLQRLDTRRTNYSPSAIQVGPVSYEALPLDLVLCDSSLGVVTVLLRSDHKRGDSIIIKLTNSAAYPVVITPAVGLIDGEESRTLAADYDVCNLISDGSDWWAV